MNKPIIFIDGQEGTTGLQIFDRLSARDDIELLTIPESRRKDPSARKERMNAADLVFLCLPDAAAIEAVALVDNPDTRIIDASTAHRTQDGWAYGFPELSPSHRDAIRDCKRIANPGCHATGFISSVYPLVAAGLIPDSVPLTCFSLTGYSGGGKKMIAQYEGEKTGGMFSPRLYGLNLHHKHIPEMQLHCALKHAPLFCPVVDDYYKGMATTVMLPHGLLKAGTSAHDIYDALAAHYAEEKLVHVAPFGWDEPMIDANAMAGRDSLLLIVNGGEEQTIVTALFDNLGKGASGAAVQNMNLALGFEETKGLER